MASILTLIVPLWIMKKKINFLGNINHQLLGGERKTIWKKEKEKLKGFYGQGEAQMAVCLLGSLVALRGANKTGDRWKIPHSHE